MENLRSFFYTIISTEVNEKNLQNFQEFLISLIDDAIGKIDSYPSPDEKALENKTSIFKLGNKAFRCGSICYLPLSEEDVIYVVGDIHGDIDSFTAILENIHFFDTAKNKNIKVVFLGDYIDRGLYGLNVLLGILFLKKYYNEKIILLKGNHEIWREDKEGDEVEIISTVLADNMFLDFWKEYFDIKTLRKIKDFFDKLPAILILNNGIILVHAGIPRPGKKEARGYEYLKDLNSLNDPEIIEEMLWSRPEDKEDVIITYNSPSFLFAEKQFNEFMDKIEGKWLIRSHDPFLEGFRSFFKGRLISIFSTGGKDNEKTYYPEVNPVYLRLSSDEIIIYKFSLIKKIKLK